MALCDKECMVAWPLPVTDSSVSKLDFRPILFQKKVVLDQCCGLALPEACVKGGERECAAGVEGERKTFIVRSQLFSLKVK